MMPRGWMLSYITSTHNFDPVSTGCFGEDGKRKLLPVVGQADGQAGLGHRLDKGSNRDSDQTDALVGVKHTPPSHLRWPHPKVAVLLPQGHNPVVMACADGGRYVAIKGLTPSDALVRIVAIEVQGRLAEVTTPEGAVTCCRGRRWEGGG